MTKSTTDSPYPRYASLPIDDSRPESSSWGVFGDDDEKGTINFISPEARLHAASLVRSGESIALSWDVDLPDPGLFGRRSPVHHVHAFPTSRDEHYDLYFPQSSSQWDGLTHVRHPSFGFYNGVSEDDVNGPSARLGIHNWSRDGIVGRYVLADVAAYLAEQGQPIDCSTRFVVDADLLQRTLDHQATTRLDGDILLIRFGWSEYYESLGQDEREHLAKDPQAATPGLAIDGETPAWLWDTRVAAIVGDNPAVEAMPFDTTTASGFGHYRYIATLGFALGEMFDLARLSEACRADGRYDGLFVASPMMKTGGVGSAANATAIR